MLRFRLIVAALLIIPLLALLVGDVYVLPAAPGALLFPFGAATVLLAAHELSRMLSRGGYPHSYAGAMGGVALVWLACGIVVYWPLSGEAYPADCPIGKLGWALGGQAVAVMLAFLPAIRNFDTEQPGHLGRVAATLVPSVYLGLPTTFFIWLRLFEDGGWGLVALASVIVIVKSSDVGAYTFGRLLGRHKMAPKLSPKKSMEGLLGGLLTAALVSVLFFWLAPPRIAGALAEFTISDAVSAAAYGLILGVLGVVGDLAESLIKRDVDAKDSGLLPGLGGFLDVLDSVIFAAPIAYLCWAVGLVGPGGPM